MLFGEVRFYSIDNMAHTYCTSNGIELYAIVVVDVNIAYYECDPIVVVWFSLLKINNS